MMHFLIKIYYEMHDIYAHFSTQILMYDAFVPLSIQFHHTISTPMSHPLKFNAVVELVAITNVHTKTW